MVFTWPWLLLSLILLPLFVVGYILILRRRRRFSVRYSSLTLIKAALPKRRRWRQHVPFGLFMLALLFLMLALSRPVSEIEVPLSRTSIILALDVSRSMCATDVEPNRLTIAQEAALSFIEDQADGTQIGIVAFAGLAEIILPPTNDKEVLKDTVENLTTSLGTAIGSATLKSIDAIAEINEAVEPSGINLGSEQDIDGLSSLFYQPDIIVLLTDGANTRGPNPLDAARQAADRQIRVYTIGFGTDNPQEMVCTREQLGGDVFAEGFSGGGFGGFSGNFGDFRRFIVLDAETLQAVADLTGGEYYRAENADQLLDVFLELPTQIVLQKQRTEISFVFLALGAFFAIGAILVSFLWRHFP